MYAGVARGGLVTAHSGCVRAPPDCSVPPCSQQHCGGMLRARGTPRVVGRGCGLRQQRDPRVGCPCEGLAAMSVGSTAQAPRALGLAGGGQQDLHGGSPQKRSEILAVGSGFGSLIRHSHWGQGWAASAAFALQIPSPCPVCHCLPQEGRAPPLLGHCQGLSKAVCVQNVLGVFGGVWQSCCTIWVRAGTE